MMSEEFETVPQKGYQFQTPFGSSDHLQFLLIAMAFTVSINGADNVGKTTQIGLLPCRFNILLAGSLHESDDKLGILHRNGTLKDWWWKSTDEELVSGIFDALDRRYVRFTHTEEAAMTVFDRGTAMFEAVAIAAIAVKSNNRDLAKSRERLQTILSKLQLQLPKEHLAILLKHTDNIKESIETSLTRETEPVDTRYRLYQTLLHEELWHQENQGIYHHTIYSGLGETHLDVQKKIRAVINIHKPPILHLSLPPVLHTISTIYAFSGLSEAGKSTMARSVCAHYGPELAVRTKIAYFLSQASDKLGRSVYDLPERDQALKLLHELETFSNHHYWIEYLTIESLHRSTMTMWLKTWLGGLLQILYVDTADEVRVERSIISPENLERNDVDKRKRGAHEIRFAADLVLDNNGPMNESLMKLSSFLEPVTRTDHRLLEFELRRRIPDSLLIMNVPHRDPPLLPKIRAIYEFPLVAQPSPKVMPGYFDAESTTWVM